MTSTPVRCEDVGRCIKKFCLMNFDGMMLEKLRKDLCDLFGGVDISNLHFVYRNGQHDFHIFLGDERIWRRVRNGITEEEYAENRFEMEIKYDDENKRIGGEVWIDGEMKWIEKFEDLHELANKNYKREEQDEQMCEKDEFVFTYLTPLNEILFISDEEVFVVFKHKYLLNYKNMDKIMFGRTKLSCIRK